MFGIFKKMPEQESNYLDIAMFHNLIRSEVVSGKMILGHFSAGPSVAFCDKFCAKFVIILHLSLPILSPCHLLFAYPLWVLLHVFS